MLRPLACTAARHCPAHLGRAHALRALPGVVAPALLAGACAHRGAQGGSGQGFGAGWQCRRQAAQKASRGLGALRSSYNAERSCTVAGAGCSALRWRRVQIGAA